MATGALLNACELLSVGESGVASSVFGPAGSFFGDSATSTNIQASGASESASAVGHLPGRPRTPAAVPDAPALLQRDETMEEDPFTPFSPPPVLSFDDGLFPHFQAHPELQLVQPVASPGPQLTPRTPGSSSPSAASTATLSLASSPARSPDPDHEQLEAWLEEVLSSDSWPGTDSD